MKRVFFNIYAVAALAGAFATGCSSPAPHRPVVVTPTGEVFVRENPPPARSEAMGGAPDMNEVWVPGYYTYSNSHWVWMPGRWEFPPQSGETWVAGHWDHNARGWVFTPGHWE